VPSERRRVLPYVKAELSTSAGSCGGMTTHRKDHTMTIKTIEITFTDDELRYLERVLRREASAMEGKARRTEDWRKERFDRAASRARYMEELFRDKSRAAR